MTTPDGRSETDQGPFSATLIAQIANELFHAVTAPEGGPVAVTPAPVGPGPVRGVQLDAVEHAVENPATTADVSSTSIPAAPSTGVMDAYNLSSVDLGSFDGSGYLQVLDGLDADLLSLPSPQPTAPPGAEDGPVPPGAPEPQVDDPGAGIPDADLLAEKLGEVPTDVPGLLEAVKGDHPYLQDEYEAALAAVDADDAGTGQLGLEQMQSVAQVAQAFSGEHAVDDPDLAEVPDYYHHVAGSTTEEAAERPVASAESEAGYLQDHLNVLAGQGVEVAGQPEADEADYGFAPQLEPAEDVPALDIAPTTTGFNAQRHREDFPILSERINGRPLVWLDNAATTQKPRQVIDRLSYFYEHENSNVHRAAHTLAGRATDAYEGAREKVRHFINAPNADDIVWVRGTTEGINLIANTFGEQEVCEGDEVLITWLEHHANIVPWQMLCHRKKATLRVAPVDDTGQIILSEFERLITPRTKVIAFTHVSNALGTITPAKEMIEIAHRHGVPVVVDGAQGVVHMPVDVQDLDCDFYVFSGHKMFAPTGIGVVYGKQEYLEKMPPWQGGGNMIDQVHFDRTTFQPPPWRFEAGTGSIADAVGLGAAIDYLDRIGMADVELAEHELLAYATEQLLTVPGLCIYGHADRKAGVLSFNVAGYDAVTVGAYLDQDGIAVRAGHHCAQPILRRFGVEATVRAALALYNTDDDIDRLVAALHRMTAGTADLD